MLVLEKSSDHQAIKYKHYMLHYTQSSMTQRVAPTSDTPYLNMSLGLRRSNTDTALEHESRVSKCIPKQGKSDIITADTGYKHIVHVDLVIKGMTG